MLIAAFTGCTSKDAEKETDIAATQDMQLVYEETASPNKDYVESEEDIVEFTVEIYQGKDNKILVYAKSNSEFFKPLQYELEYDKELSKSDVSLEWTTAMGNPDPTANDQIGIAYVSILEDGDVMSEWKINFANKAIEIIEDALEQK